MVRKRCGRYHFHGFDCHAHLALIEYKKKVKIVSVCTGR